MLLVCNCLIGSFIFLPLVHPLFISVIVLYHKVS